MKYKSSIKPTALAVGALIALVSCAGKPAAQSGIQTPAERLPTPSRSLPAGAATPGTTQAALPPWLASPPFESHDYSKPLPLADKSGLEYAVLAGGCFWCLEAVFELVPGVVDVVSGYTGGEASRPSYEFVSTGQSGHAEAVRIAFDPAKVNYGRLLDYFWKIHDPTTLNRQGYDVGTQYRSAIFYVNEGQRAAAEASIDAQRPLWSDPIVTQLLPAGDFWIAEEYHQDFFRRNPDYGYCTAVIAPKVEKSGLAN